MAVISATVFERSGCTLLARVTGHDGAPIVRSALSAGQYEVWDVSARPASRVAGPTTLDLAATVFDRLQLDRRWSADAVGYNLRLPLSPAALPADRVYRVEVKLTPVVGEPFRVLFELRAVKVYGD